jgi:hypothetical protein
MYKISIPVLFLLFGILDVKCDDSEQCSVVQLKNAFSKRFDDLEAKLNRILAKLDDSVQLDKDIVEKIRAELKLYINTPQEHLMPLLHLAFKLKNQSLGSNGKLVQLQDQLPAHVRRIVWSNICLKPADDKYLYALERSPFEGEAADQLLGVSRFGKRPEKGFSWSVEMSADGNAFFLKNVEFDRYLYATDKLFEHPHYKLALGPFVDDPAYKWTAYTYSNVSVILQNVGYAKHLDHICGHSTSLVHTVCISTGEYYWIVQKC